MSKNQSETINVIELPENRCQSCGKKEATLLCDKVKMYSNNGIKCSRDNGCKPMKDKIHHCNKQICEDCATHIDGADYCPDCIKQLKKGVKQ